MTTRLKAFRRLAYTALVLAATSPQAFAQDNSVVAERLKQLLAEQSGMALTWTGITGDASHLVLQGVTVQPAGAAQGFPLGDLTFDGITEADGGFEIEQISSGPYSFTEDQAAVSISPAIFTNVTLPAAGSSDPLASMVMYESANVEQISVKVAGADVFAMTNLNASVTPPENGEPMEFEGGVESFNADFTTLPDPQSKTVLDALGYTKMSGSIDLAGTWDPTGGRVEMSQYDMTVDNAGTLGMTVDLSGYTPAFMKSLQELQQKMAAQPAGTDNSAQGLAMLGLMQQLTFNGASMRFDDDGLTDKLLTFFSAQQGVSKADLANQAKAVLPFALAQLNNPELTAQITAAVNKFLDDPQSLEVSAEPAQPVPFAMLAATGMSTPMDLPKQLGVTVTANEGDDAQ